MKLTVLPDILANLAASHPKPALLRYKAEGTFRDLSTEEVCRAVRDATLGLREAGIERGDRVAILSENRPEWTIADLAIQCVGAINVPIYPTLLDEQIRFILADCGARAVVCSTTEQLGKIARVRDGLEALRTVVALDPIEGPPAPDLPWSDLCAGGAKLAAAHPGLFDEMRSAVQPGDLASIIYTSGTTGVPKGVMLTHANFISNVLATIAILPMTDRDVALSFLPLSHVLERMAEYAYLSRGATIAYAESVETLPQDLQAVSPTIVAMVPRVFEKFHSRVMDAVRSGSAVKRALFGWALRVGQARVPYLLEGRPLPRGLALRAALADRLVFSKIRERVGGRISYFISGGAPLNADLARFFWGAGLPVYEGYGLTETSPVISVNCPGRARLGTVGPVVADVEVRIAEDGEILVRGPNVMQGYYRNEEANQQIFRDGWLCTGDIGMLDADGFLAITDRKKDVIKTSGGKIVAPQPMENDLKADRYIANAVVVGERRRFISALLVPDFAGLETFCGDEGLDRLPREEQLRHPKVQELFRRRIDRAMEGRPRYEQVKAFRLLPRELTLEDGEMTPTLKVKRSVVERKFQELSNSMYEEGVGS